jgi:hypothetical protein
MKDLVTYEMSKKLQEKGFPQHWAEVFYADGDGMWVEDFSTEEPTFKAGELIINYYGLPTDGSEVAAPTIYRVMEWLRNYKNIHIEIRLFFKNSFGFDIIRIDDMTKLGWSGTVTYPRYELCAIYAINYVIDNCI